MICTHKHDELQEIMKHLPMDQGGKGRHKCAACAYVKGYEDGKELKDSLSINNVLEHLDESQAGAQRHKSPHAAYALGYYKGVCERTNMKN